MQFSYEYFVVRLADGWNKMFRYGDYVIDVFGIYDEYEFDLFKGEDLILKKKYKDAYTLLRKSTVEGKTLKEIWYDLIVVQ